MNSRPPLSAVSPLGAASARWQIRPVAAADLPLLQPWLAPGADTRLPEAPSEAWWLLSGRAGGRDGPQACLRLRAGIGLQRPRHWFHVGCVVHAAPELKLFHRQTTLLLGNDHTGASELADFACAPGLDSAEQASVWQALLQAAARQLQAFPAAHAGGLIVELPGLREGGQSPFWQGLGRHFYDADLDALARQHGPDWRSHLAALLPRQPVHTAFLSPAAQAAIAQVPPEVRAWMDVLAHAGFRYSHHVGITDGGPVFDTSVAALVAALLG